MCGRFTLHSPPDSLAEHFDVEFAVRSSRPASTSRRVNRFCHHSRADFGVARCCSRLRRWGLVPHWARDAAAIGKPNDQRARGDGRREARLSQAAFRGSAAAWCRRRLLRVGRPIERRKSSPTTSSGADRRLFAFAGLFEVWHAGSEDELRTSCTIVTTEANRGAADTPRAHARRSSTRATTRVAGSRPQRRSRGARGALLAPCPEAPHAPDRRLRVNSPSNDDPECVATAGRPSSTAAASRVSCCEAGGPGRSPARGASSAARAHRRSLRRVGSVVPARRRSRELWFGLPDWVTVALLCYAAARC